MKGKHLKKAMCAAAGAAGAALLLKTAHKRSRQSVVTIPRGKSGAYIVFVHGLGGWGEGAKLNDLLPHWGLMSGSIKKYLEAQGYEACAVSINPVASTWDRACELFAQLTGTRTDYGEAHAKAHGHARFGPTYKKLGEWPGRKIHLVGHSFGGATIRLFAQLCAQGSAEERTATPAEELSPLFSGTLGGNIISVTTFAAPHNGTTALLSPVKGVCVGLLEFLIYGLMAVNTISPGLSELYPCRLEQFGIADYKGIKKTAKQLFAFSLNDDNVKYDLSIDGAAELNRGIQCQPDIYYFSFAGEITHETAAGHRIPNISSFSLLTAESSFRMGRKALLRIIPGGNALDKRWLPNDGQVNTISALFPFNEPHREYKPEKILPGVWQVMPLMKDWDHYDSVGGFRLGGKAGVKELYLSLARMLEQLPPQ